LLKLNKKSGGMPVFLSSCSNYGFGNSYHGSASLCRKSNRKITKT
jgi:hypothetical protein